MLVYVAVKKVQPPERRESNGKEKGIGHPQFFFFYVCCELENKGGLVMRIGIAV